MLEKQDQMLNKMDRMENSIKGEIYDLRTYLRSYLDRRLSGIDNEIQQVKGMIGLL